MPATVTAKGQITIPVSVRRALGLEPGSLVDFKRLEDGTIALVREGRPQTERFSRSRGTATTTLTTEEIMALTRGEE